MKATRDSMTTLRNLFLRLFRIFLLLPLRVITIPDLEGFFVFKYVDSRVPRLNCCSAAKFGDLMLANTLPQE